MDDRVHPEIRRTATGIGTMEIRGTAAIADATVRALRTQVTESNTADTEAFRTELRATARTFHETRPAAVSLPNALRYVLRDVSSTTVEGLRQSVIDSADEFCARLERARADLGQIGANRLHDGDTIMTHCHSADVLVCAEATAEQGKHIEAVVEEARSRDQERITTKQLHELGVSITLIVDSATRRYLNDVDYVLVGTDAVAIDGSVINKIGTSGLTVSARKRGTPIMVTAQTLKLHPGMMAGHTVDIEMCDTAEVVDDDTLTDLGDPTVRNPMFDMTPPRYVDTIITGRGQFPPENIVILMRKLLGEDTSEPWAEPSPRARP